MTRLIKISNSIRDSESTRIVQIHSWQNKPAAIERIEEVYSYFKSSCLGKLCLLKDIEILSEERLTTQTAVGWSRVTEEAQRVGVKGCIFCRANRRVGAIVRCWEREGARVYILISDASGRCIGVKRLPG